jgi:hypothetical protein
VVVWVLQATLVKEGLCKMVRSCRELVEKREAWQVGVGGVVAGSILVDEQDLEGFQKTLMSGARFLGRVGTLQDWECVSANADECEMLAGY